MLKEKKNSFENLSSIIFFKIYKPCWEQFHAGTIFFLPNYSPQPYHCAEGGVHLAVSPGLHF